MKSYRSHYSFSLLQTLAAVLLLGASPFRAVADYDYWNGSTSNDWDANANWYYRAPIYYDDAWFTSQTANQNLIFSQPLTFAGYNNTSNNTDPYYNNEAHAILFDGNGGNYTIGTTSGSAFYFDNYTGIDVRAGLTSINGTETINAPIQSSGYLFLANFSPASATTPSGSAYSSIYGTAGYGNTLVDNGSISASNANGQTTQLNLLGTGNINLNGSLSDGTSQLRFVMDTEATVTETGTSTYTGQTYVSGNLILDYTTNNTNKLSANNNDLIVGYGNSNGGGGGGKITLVGNGNAATVQNAGNLYVRNGFNQITVNGTNGQTATLNLGNVYDQANAAAGVIDFETNSGGVITTTSYNASYNGGYAVNILGPFATYGETYWAQASTQPAWADPRGNAGGSIQITALTQDDGDAFNNIGGNYTVDSGGQVLNAAVLGSNEGADTVRFASAGTLDLGGGQLNMEYGGIMVAKGVTGNTQISNGVINSYSGAVDLINYSTGTLNVSAKFSNEQIAKAGTGDVILTGDNSAMQHQSVVIDQGKLILGSATALGSDNYLYFAGTSTTLDLKGQSISLNSLNSNDDLLPGNAAAAAGYNVQITNSVAGTISTVKVEGNPNISSGNNGGASTTASYNYPILGQYTGGLNEVSGSIISLDVEQGPGSAPVQFNLGTSDPWNGDPTGGNSVDASGLTGYSTLITGAIKVGANATLGLIGYSNVQTLGALVVNGGVGPAAQQNASLGSTYLSGTGNFTSGNGAWNYWLNTSGSVTDTFNGNFGSTTFQTPMALIVAGTGSASFVNPINSYGVSTYGTARLTINSLIDNATMNISGDSTVTVTGTSGVVTGGHLGLYGSTLIIAPSATGGAVTVSNAQSNSFNYVGEAQIILDRGQNTSLTYNFTAGNGDYFQGGNQDSTFIVGSVQGLSALGNTDKFVILGGSNIVQPDGIAVEAAIIGDQSHHSFFGVNFAPGSTQDATFLTYVGSNQASDQGFTAYSFAAGNINNINSSTQGSIERISAGATGSQNTLSQNTAVGNLELDGGIVSTGNYSLVTQDDKTAYAPYNFPGTSSIIFNSGASINGTVVQNAATTYYTDLGNGSISSLNANGNDVVKAGAGTLTITSFNNVNNVIINDGALDVGGSVASAGSGSGFLVLHGGVLQGFGTYTSTLGYYGSGHIAFDVDNDYSNSMGGGFSARGGVLDVTLYDSATGINLSWGGTGYFLAEGAVLDFGSTSSDSVVFFNNNLDLGPGGNSNSLYARVISVTGNSADAGMDPLSVADFTVMTGNITANTNPYVGLEKDGTGVLYLQPVSGENTYTGATVIANGTLGIGDDSNLGTAPTAAYAQNTTPGLAGDALTPGAVQINGGATLAAYQDVVLNRNRQILLASGATGSIASNIDVAADSTLSFGGLIGDYIGEVGSLNVEGAGTFRYSGVSANTGTDSVSGGTFAVTGAGSVNSVSGIVLNNATSTSHAEFNYSSSTALTRSVTFAATRGTFGGGTFAYNSSAAYTGGPLNVINNGVLSGSGNLGTTAVTIGATGTITPGQVDPTPGTLTQGATTFLTGGNYNFLVADATGAAGTGYSTVNATSLDISSLGTFTINLESLDGMAPGNAADFNSAQSYSFVLVDAADGITGAFDPSQFTVMTTANNGATGFSNTFTGTWSVSENGNDLLLNYTAAAVPEPSTYAMVGLGLLGLVAFNRWRKRNA